MDIRLFYARQPDVGTLRARVKVEGGRGGESLRSVFLANVDSRQGQPTSNVKRIIYVSMVNMVNMVNLVNMVNMVNLVNMVSMVNIVKISNNDQN